MLGDVCRHHKETYIMSSNNFHKIIDCSHMASGEMKDGIEK